jgi:ArsR family transcriptional regulator
MSFSEPHAVAAATASKLDYITISIYNCGVAARQQFELQNLKAEFFKALGHPTRVRILEILRHGGRSVQELQEALALDQSIVSQHLARLRGKDVVVTEKEGTTVRYTVRDPAVGELLDVARRIFSRHLQGSQTMLRELQREHRVARRR